MRKIQKKFLLMMLIVSVNSLILSACGTKQISETKYGSYSLQKVSATESEISGDTGTLGPVFKIKENSLKILVSKNKEPKDTFYIWITDKEIVRNDEVYTYRYDYTDEDNYELFIKYPNNKKYKEEWSGSNGMSGGTRDGNNYGGDKKKYMGSKMITALIRFYKNIPQSGYASESRNESAWRSILISFMILISVVLFLAAKMAFIRLLESRGEGTG